MDVNGTLPVPVDASKSLLCEEEEDDDGEVSMEGMKACCWALLLALLSVECGCRCDEDFAVAVADAAVADNDDAAEEPTPSHTYFLLPPPLLVLAANDTSSSSISLPSRMSSSSCS